MKGITLWILGLIYLTWIGLYSLLVLISFIGNTLYSVNHIGTYITVLLVFVGFIEDFNFCPECIHYPPSVQGHARCSQCQVLVCVELCEDWFSILIVYNWFLDVIIAGESPRKCKNYHFIPLRKRRGKKKNMGSLFFKEKKKKLFGWWLT